MSDEDPGTLDPAPEEGATQPTAFTGAEGSLDATRTGPSPSGPGAPGRPGTALPESIGTYKVLEELGRGGMGVVYAVWDPRLERRIALKVLPSRIGDDPAALKRFQREARLLAALNHPGIATIHSLEEAEGRHFLTMEVVEGEELAHRIREGAVPVDQTLAVCRQIASALEAAHRSGIVHLDLKPQNVMVAKAGGVKVLDFGLAMALGNATDGSTEDVRTRAQMQESIAGTPGYMSPEQVRGLSVDSRADIWAFGCVLFECLSGRPAVAGATVLERMRATLEVGADLTDLPESTPPRVRNLLERCLTRDPEARLDTISRARREIEEEIALRSLPSLQVKPETIPNNLPVPLSSFVGREVALSEVAALLLDRRLVTVTGVGGGGKTRLATEVGRQVLERFPDGATFVRLAPISSPDEVASSVVGVMKLKETAGRTQTEILIDQLREKTSLLILDNCEHLVDAVADLAAALLEGCPGLRILLTSREALRIDGEAEYHLPTLSLPSGAREPDPVELSRVESVRLFVERAKAAQPAFELTRETSPAVAQLCRRLDGIPLAIELAAARIRLLSLEEISKRLDDRFRLLTSHRRASLPHHQTLRTLIDWSYDHLADPEQALLRRLSVFAGGWMLEAAETICGGDGIDEWEVLDLLTHLVDKSLVEVDAKGGLGTGRPRYRMLETIREYARARLNEGSEAPEILSRHRDFYLVFAEDADGRLVGPEQQITLKRMASEHHNLRLAFEECMAVRTAPDLGWRLAGALGRYWTVRGHWREGREAFGRLLARPESRAATVSVAKGLNWAGNLAKLQGEYAHARAFLEESLTIRRSLGDEGGIAASLHNLANVVKDQGDYDNARLLYEESLELQRKLGNGPGIGLALNCLGILTQLTGDFDAARALHEESLGIRRDVGDRLGTAASLNNLGAVSESLGLLDDAFVQLEESLAILRELGDRWGVAAALHNLARLAERRDDIHRAQALYEESLSTFRELGDRRGVATSLHNLGTILRRIGNREGGKESLRESLQIFREIQDCGSIPAVLSSLGALAVDSRDFARATRLLGAAESLVGIPGPEPSAPRSEDRAELIGRLRSTMVDAEFEQAWAEGRSMDLGAAIACAMEDSR